MTKTERFKKLLAERDAAELAAGPPPAAELPAAPDPYAGMARNQKTGKQFMLVRNIVPDPHQPRATKDVDVEEIGRLAESIRNGKQLQAIVVEWKPDLGKWMIVVGERRWLAAIAAGMDAIACTFIHEPLAAGERLKMQMTENLQRVNFTDEERAGGFRRLMDLNNWNQAQLAKEMNLHPGTVSRALQASESRGAIPSEEVTKELRGAIPEAEIIAPRNSPPKGKRGPKAGKVRKFTTTNGCKMTLAFPQKPTEDEIRDALREVLHQVSQDRKAA
jgi:ParB/RepB/Spo0J family partition protein